MPEKEKINYCALYEKAREDFLELNELFEFTIQQLVKESQRNKQSKNSNLELFLFEFEDVVNFIFPLIKNGYEVSISNEDPEEEGSTNYAPRFKYKVTFIKKPDKEN